MYEWWIILIIGTSSFQFLIMNPVAIYHFLLCRKVSVFIVVIIFCFVYDQKWRFLGGTFRVLEIRSLDGVGVGGPPKGLPRPLAPWVRKVGRSVISTSRRELGWILVLLQECYQFALWRPLAAAQAWTRYPLSGARTGTGSAPTGHFLFWSRYPLFQDGVLPQGIRISIPQLAEIVEFQFLMQAQKIFWCSTSQKKVKKWALLYLSSDKKWQQYSQFYPISLHRNDMFWVGWVFDREQMLRGLVFF